MPARTPEEPKSLKIGSSNPKIYQLPFEEAVRRMVVEERNRVAIGVEFVDDFFAPDTRPFKLQAVYSNEPVTGWIVTKGGYLANVKDADYVMYEGQTRMKGFFLGRDMERDDRFLIMQSYLDPNTYTMERNRIVQSLPPVPIPKSSKQDKAS